MVGRLDLAMRFVCVHQLSGRHILVIGYFRQSFDVTKDLLEERDKRAHKSNAVKRIQTAWDVYSLYYSHGAGRRWGSELGRTAIGIAAV